MPKAKSAATKALEMDDQLAEAHVSLGYASFTYDEDWLAAGKPRFMAKSLILIISLAAR